MKDFTTLSPQQVRDYHKINCPHLPIEQLARQQRPDLNGGYMANPNCVTRQYRKKNIFVSKHPFKFYVEAERFAKEKRDDGFVTKRTIKDGMYDVWVYRKPEQTEETR